MRSLLPMIGWAGLVSLLAASTSVAQIKAERVKITTVDGVDLRGHYYAGKPQGPVAILLHAFESNSRTKDWIALSEALQRAGYNVLAFDFRGHGDSTDIDPAVFWSNPTNQVGIKNPNPKRGSIEAKDFKPAYHIALVNDIAAVKAFLDRKNDLKLCNTASTVIIGADEGATLGAIWLNSEFYRFRKSLQPGIGYVQAKQPEGADVCAFMALTPSAKVGASAANLGSTLWLASRTNATPMVFLYGENDGPGKTFATALEKKLKDPKDKVRFQFTKAYEVPGTKLTGAGLLRVARTTKDITDYLDEVVVAKGKEYFNRDWDKSMFYWISAGAPTPARLLPPLVPTAENNMRFETYYKFIAR